MFFIIQTILKYHPLTLLFSSRSFHSGRNLNKSSLHWPSMSPWWLTRKSKWYWNGGCSVAIFPGFVSHIDIKWPGNLDSHIYHIHPVTWVNVHNLKRCYLCISSIYFWANLIYSALSVSCVNPSFEIWVRFISMLFLLREVLVLFWNGLHARVTNWWCNITIFDGVVGHTHRPLRGLEMFDYTNT